MTLEGEEQPVTKERDVRVVLYQLQMCGECGVKIFAYSRKGQAKSTEKSLEAQHAGHICRSTIAITVIFF